MIFCFSDASNNDIEVTYGFMPPAPADARDEDQTNKGNAVQENPYTMIRPASL